MINENIKATGRLKVQLIGADGTVKEDFETQNIVTTVGKTWIAGRFADTGIPTHMTHMAIGSDATSEVVGDTVLGTELARVATTVAGGTPTTNTVQWVATFGAGVGTGTVVEAGILNAASSGTLLARTTFGAVTKGADDSLTVTWTVTIN